MLDDGLLGILLHACVDGSIDAETIVVEVVWGAVGFGVLVAEAVKRVLLPLAEIDMVLHLVPLGVVALLRLLGGEHLTQILAEIWC